MQDFEDVQAGVAGRRHVEARGATGRHRGHEPGVLIVVKEHPAAFELAPANALHLDLDRRANGPAGGVSATSGPSAEARGAAVEVLGNASANAVSTQASVIARLIPTQDTMAGPLIYVTSWPAAAAARSCRGRPRTATSSP